MGVNEDDRSGDEVEAAEDDAEKSSQVGVHDGYRVRRSSMAVGSGRDPPSLTMRQRAAVRRRSS